MELLTFATDPTCFGFSDGTVAAVATGGLGGGFDFCMGSMLRGERSWRLRADVTGPAGGRLPGDRHRFRRAVRNQRRCLPSKNAHRLWMSTWSATGVSCFGDADGTASAYSSTTPFRIMPGPALAGLRLLAQTLIRPHAFAVTRDSMVSWSPLRMVAWAPGALEVTSPDPFGRRCRFLSSPELPWTCPTASWAPSRKVEPLITL